MPIQKEFVLRYRDHGHVRFQIPIRLCDTAVANTLTRQIAEIADVKSVKLFRSQHKLSIRYHTELCDFTQLIQRLFQKLGEMEQQGLFSAPTPQTKRTAIRDRVTEKIKQLRVSRWANEKYGAAKETVHAAKVLGKLGSKGPKALIKDPEKTITDFLNDVLVLYLIKLHWPRITQEWLPRPFVHRYEWLATFYMFYLLVRSRRPK